MCKVGDLTVFYLYFYTCILCIYVEYQQYWRNQFVQLTWYSKVSQLCHKGAVSFPCMKELLQIFQRDWNNETTKNRKIMLILQSWVLCCFGPDSDAHYWRRYLWSMSPCLACTQFSLSHCIHLRSISHALIQATLATLFWGFWILGGFGNVLSALHPLC